MKIRSFTLSVLITLISITTFAQNENRNIESAIIQFFDGLSDTDPDKIKNHITSDFQLLEDGEIWNIDTLINKIMPMKGRGVIRVNTFEFIRLEQQGIFAWVSYFNTADFSSGEKKRSVKWLESSVLKKENNKWKIQMLHSTVIRQK